MNKINDTTWGATRSWLVGNHEHRLDFEIGDLEDQNYHPQLKLKKWDNECNFSMRLPGAGNSIIQDNGDQIISTRGNITLIATDGGNGIDMQIVLDQSLPQIILTTQTKNIAFSRIPIYTDEQGNSITTLPPNTVYYADGVPKAHAEGVRRSPIETQGSYPVYHQSKRNNQYAAGKVCQIFRPIITFDDATQDFVPITINQSNNIVYDLSGFSGPLPWVIS